MTATADQILKDILQNGIDVHRCAAARAIGRMAIPGAVEALTEALLDEDPDVRADAAQALRDIGDPAAAEPLMRNLVGDPDPDVKKPALEALIDMQHAEVVPLLMELVTSRTDAIEWDDDEFFSDEWDSWIDLQMMAIKGLGQMRIENGAPGILMAMADEEGQDVTVQGIKALARMGKKGARAISIIFKDDNDQLRRRVAEAVVASDNPHCDALCDEMLADSSARVRIIALDGLPTDDARLADLFADEDAEVRAAVVAHAGAQFPEKVAELIKDKDDAVRREAFAIVAKYPDLFVEEGFAESVQKAIAGEPKAAKQAALALLALRGGEVIRGLSHAMTNTKLPLDFRLGVVDVMKEAGPDATPHLLQGVGDDDRQMRLATMTALVGFAANDPVWPNPAGEGLLAALRGELVDAPEQGEEDEPVADELPEALPDEDEDKTPLVPVVDDAGEEDGAEGATSTLDSILSPVPEALDDRDPEEIILDRYQRELLERTKQRRMPKRKVSLDVEVAPHVDVRRFAATLLGGVPNPQVTEALTALLAEDDAEMQEAALTSLVEHGEATGTLDGAAYEALEPFVAAGPTVSRVLAVRAMARVASDKVAPRLTELLGDADPQVRVEVVRGRAVRGIDDDLTDACLSDSYPGVGLAAASAIAEMRGPDAVEPLITFACDHDGTYRDLVGQLLGHHAGQAGIDRLLELLQDPERKREYLVMIDALATAHEAYQPENDTKVA